MSEINGHPGNCHDGAGHKHIVMTVTVADKDVEFVTRALGVFRSGLLAGYATDEPEYACSFEGPFSLKREDEVILQAIADEEGGRFEVDADEPAIIREKTLLAGVRSLVKMAS